uniref:Ig-like domain-containing protein n=1 Tax=Pygocentrus nattereri TaxID=42514 RepID=A0AAR2IWQ4_PYGNA
WGPGLIFNEFINVSVFGADQIELSKDQKTDVFKKEGEPVTLKCSYDSSSEDVYLHWYRQYPNRALQYLLDRGARSRSSYSNTADRRFESTATRSSTELSTRELRLADTALYYCVLPIIAQ